MFYTILVINPGSTSTKIGVFSGRREVFTESISHSADEIAKFNSIAEQYEFREEHIRTSLIKRNFDLASIDCIVGRGGLLRPIPGGVYKITEAMKNDLLSAKYGEHASNLGALIAGKLAQEIGKPSFIADPVVVDELSDEARISGHKDFTRKSIFHALNQKAVARRYATENKKNYEDLNLIVAHMGGGISVGLHQKGRVVDVNNALDGDGPFSPERSGTIPSGQLMKICLSGEKSEKEIKKMLVGSGGLVSYLGLNDVRDVQKRIDSGDNRAKIVYNAMMYNIGKQIGSLSAAGNGKIDTIILTGGIAYNEPVIARLTEMCSWIAPITVYAGEGELEALSLAGERALAGEAEILNYE